MSYVMRIAQTLIPLSHLALDLEPPAGIDWATYLSGRGVRLEHDDIGRLAISRADARALMAEKAAAAQRARELAAEAEKRHMAHQIVPNGVPWWKLDGATPTEAMLIAAKADEPQAKPTPGEWMFGHYQVAGSFAEEQ
jgi:hypothetical protein